MQVEVEHSITIDGYILLSDADSIKYTGEFNGPYGADAISMERGI